jgi:hypothetical protein
MERKRYRSCAAKVRYRSEHAALRVGKAVLAQRGHATRVYHCPYCDGFHLTSKGA